MLKRGDKQIHFWVIAAVDAITITITKHSKNIHDNCQIANFSLIIWITNFHTKSFLIYLLFRPFTSTFLLIFLYFSLFSFAHLNHGSFNTLNTLELRKHFETKKPPLFITKFNLKLKSKNYLQNLNRLTKPKTPWIFTSPRNEFSG